MFVIYYEILIIILFIVLFLFIVSFFKVRTAFYFFVFSLVGSIFFFYVVAILPVVMKALTISMGVIFTVPFLIKLPSYPFNY